MLIFVGGDRGKNQCRGGNDGMVMGWGDSDMCVVQFGGDGDAGGGIMVAVRWYQCFLLVAIVVDEDGSDEEQS